ncbi:MAG TPA: hypothetical protein VFY20_06480 [Gemmatimonadales bacterium]|nr:hypothetical protein [Gemmatimonadales bacterium]
MRRALGLLVLPLALALGGCPTYDRYGKLDQQDGYLPGDQFAAYGPEQAQKVAIGRALAQAHKGTSQEEFAEQIGTAVTYAKSLPDVVGVTADTAAYFLTVQFKSGWRVAVLPVSDGIAPEATPGLPGKSN